MELPEHAEIVEMEPLYALLPVIIGICLALIILFYWLPRSLRRVQIAFHVEGDHYEVHRMARTNEDAKELLKLKGVGGSVKLYLMAITGVLIMAMEILITPYEHDFRVLLLIVLLIGVPVAVSPISALAAQFTRRVGHRKTEIKSAGRDQILGLIAATIVVGLAFFGTIVVLLDLERPVRQIGGYAMLALLVPSIIAYGRILGSCWNVLVFSQKERMMGRISVLHPESPNWYGRILAFTVFVNVLAMPITALNGVFSWAVVFGGFEDMFIHSERVLEMEGYDPSSLLGEGGVIGFYVAEAAWYIANFELRQFAIAAVVIFLFLNVTIIGIAFIYEVIRLLFLGAADICGRGGIVFADPRTLRSEKGQQSRVLSFCFSGFAGYTVLLLVMSLFQRFPRFVPDPSDCASSVESGAVSICSAMDSAVMTEMMLTLSVAGQAVFLLVWLLSITRIFRLRKIHFDMNRSELKEVHETKLKIDQDMPEKNISVNELIWAARDDRLQFLYNSRKALLKQGSSKRADATRADLLLAMCTGRWEDVEERATSLLAQKGGKDGLARQALAAAAMAKRDLLEAEEELKGMDQKEPEVIEMKWVLDLMRPNAKGDIDLTQIQFSDVGWRNEDLIQRYATWFPWRRKPPLKTGPVDRFSLLSDIALLRLHGENQLAMQIIKEVGADVEDESWPRLRVAEALLHLDNNSHSRAIAIYRRLNVAAPGHPAVAGLATILEERRLTQPSREPSKHAWAEISIAKKSLSKQQTRLLQIGLPTNSVAALRMKRGHDEALMSNVWITSGKAAKAGIHPGPGAFFSNRLAELAAAVVVFMALLPFSMIWAIIGFFVMAIVYYFSATREKEMRRRNMPALIRLASRLRRKKAMIEPNEIPIGTHLLLRGLVITIQGIPLDMGYPAWVDPRRKLKEGAVSEPLFISKSKRQVRKAMTTISSALAKAQQQILNNLTTMPRAPKHSGRRPSSRPNRGTKTAATTRAGMLGDNSRPWQQEGPLHRMNPRNDSARARSSFLPKSGQQRHTKSAIGMITADDLGLGGGRRW